MPTVAPECIDGSRMGPSAALRDRLRSVGGGEVCRSTLCPCQPRIGACCLPVKALISKKRQPSVHNECGCELITQLRRAILSLRPRPKLQSVAREACDAHGDDVRCVGLSGLTKSTKGSATADAMVYKPKALR
jgi:hypothetical protein